MSGSRKGRKLRPYRTGPVGTLHVLMRTAEQEAEDEFQNQPTTAELLQRSVLERDQ